MVVPFPVGRRLRPTKRLDLVWLIFLVGIVGLAGRLFVLQVLERDDLRARAEAQQARRLTAITPRRPIVDRRGEVLAVDQPVADLYVHPVQFQEPAAQVAEKLSPLLGRPAPALVAQWGDQPTGIRAAEDLPESVARQIRALNLNGLELSPHYIRLYPQGRVGAEIVGFVNRDRQGQAGVEQTQAPRLQVPRPAVLIRQDAQAAPLSYDLPVGLLEQDETRLQLTLDLRLQREAQEALSQALGKFQAKRGAVLVMDAQDGSLLALVSEPAFDPNQFFKYPKEEHARFKNWAVLDLYEPGSTFKPINVAIALETGRVQANTVFYDEGRITVGGWPIQNFDFSTAGGNGSIEVTRILERSSNVGMVHIMERLPRKLYFEWLQRLGFGQNLETDLSPVSPTSLKSAEEFINYPIEAATASFGQGLSLTPLKLVQLYAALANGGRLVYPHVVRGLVDFDGNLVQPTARPAPVAVFSPPTSQTVVNMLEKVVTQGTGKPARIPGYRVGGKTGTAQKAGETGGYIQGKITSFVAVFPIEKPRYVVLAVADEPQAGNAFGSTVTAPVVKTVLEALIALEQIPPAQP